ncbi:MAG: prefoldin subunit beta [Candidatus Thorarchaeota archaeon]|nr:prefoldin subunit beta [Candidatus Thorarchaeota archaeon]
MAQTLPPALEDKLRKFENMRKNHEQLQMMVQQLQTQLNETEATLDELEDQPDDTVTYKSVGQVMFRVDKPELVEELSDKQETLEMKLKSTKKQRDTLQKKLQSEQEEIQLELGKHNLQLQ